MKFVIRGTKVNKKGKEKFLYLQDIEDKATEKYTMGSLKTAMVFETQPLAKMYVADHLVNGYISGRFYFKVMEIWAMNDSEYNMLCEKE